MNMTGEDVRDCLLNGSIKRESACSTKRRHKMNGNTAQAYAYEMGIILYDEAMKETHFCSVYDRPIDDLTLLEVVNLWDDNRRMFTKWHMVRYSVIMMGELSIVNNYKGRMFDPDSFLSSLEG